MDNDMHLSIYGATYGAIVSASDLYSMDVC